ncbi:MAG: cobyric acid synthase [Clostridiaceae bacterium]|jgi:adenosylcobyric acid synthase|nr:cobyric acid synthase [Clostridiaceae bacterium]
MAKTIMIQGTMSSVGKSLLCTGLCRVFWQDGYRVAPFKSQNMSSFCLATPEGLFMSQAQVIQAEAAGIKPDVRMNPILLMPKSDMGSEVIVNGVSRGHMKAVDYFQYKNSLIQDILRAFHSLSSEFDIVVIEGAGSPAEINLKQNDIVNVGLARMCEAPVLLVGDIDRGGVFAQLYGTIALLEEDEKTMIKGMIINKFRGDINLLIPGLHMIEEITNKPVLGVLPMLDINLPEEDSLSMGMHSFSQNRQGKASDTQRQREAQYDNLAKAIRENVNLEEIYSILDAGL